MLFELRIHFPKTNLILCFAVSVFEMRPSVSQTGWNLQPPTLDFLGAETEGVHHAQLMLGCGQT